MSESDEQRRSPVGFADFVVARGDALWRSAWLLTGDAHLAEDLVQTALGRSFHVWPRLGAGEFEAYVRRVVFTSYLGWRRRRSFAERPVGELPDTVAPAPVRPSEDVVRALSALPARQRAVVVLRYFDDLTERETARVLGCSVGTVKSHAARALAALRSSPHLSTPEGDR